MLSRARKEILLKTVALVMPNYAMSVYLLPKDLCRELEGMMNSYWWRNNHSRGKGINWMKSKYLCNPKGHGGLRFKQLHSFNIALLGKQVWNILTRPKSLMAKVLKARYFPRTSVLQASLGYNSSFVWRSMLAAKDVVVGHNISIGNDPWLPDITDGFISTEFNEELVVAPVSCLMVPNQRIWDFDVVSDLFNARDKELILQIPLSSRRDNDAWYWQANPRGCYTVRNCYKLLNSITSDSFAGVWRKLWRLNVPSKIKNFIWRAAKNVLPTAVNLLSRRVDIISTCAVCNANEETIMHALIESSFARTCWFSSPVGFVGSCTSFLIWLEHIFARCSTDDCNIAMMICWRIWIHRNDKIWNQKIGFVQQVLNSAGQLLYQWQAAKKQLYFVDAGVHQLAHGAGRIGLGCVIRNSDGAFLAARCVGRHGAFSAREAEALGIREALSWLKEYKLPCVIVEMDCLQVFQALTEGFSGPNVFGLIIEDCRELALVIGEVKFSYVHRSANFAAHSVARAGNFMTDSRVWNCVPPPWLLNSLFNINHSFNTSLKHIADTKREYLGNTWQFLVCLSRKISSINLEIQHCIEVWRVNFSEMFTMNGIKSLYGARAKLEPLDSACLNPTIFVVPHTVTVSFLVTLSPRFTLPLPLPLRLPFSSLLLLLVLAFLPIHTHARTCSDFCSSSRLRLSLFLSRFYKKIWNLLMVRADIAQTWKKLTPEERHQWMVSNMNEISSSNSGTSKNIKESDEEKTDGGNCNAINFHNIKLWKLGFH
ncbi:hypothetical protein WN943_018699 [Citrus x changshan-huyou]